MKISWSDTKRIEDYLLDRMTPSDNFLFEAQLLLNPFLRKEMKATKKSLQLVKFYHRKQCKASLDALYKDLFTDPAHRHFQDQVFEIFRA